VLATTPGGIRSLWGACEVEPDVGGGRLDNGAPEYGVCGDGGSGGAAVTSVVHCGDGSAAGGGGDAGGGADATSGGRDGPVAGFEAGDGASSGPGPFDVGADVDATAGAEGGGKVGALGPA
jgi:hypothetical protein